MTDWLFDTFIYTGLLIALVLLVRRPVSRHFGPQVAYALWALPLARFLLPPLVLPASFAPAEVESAAEPVMAFVSADYADHSGAIAAPIEAASFAMMDLLLPVWLLGVVIFLGLRARDYLNMRRDLLADARPVGESGKIRLVETPAVNSPVAFGISDRVVALPPEFMAHYNISARDMAIAHELAHHRGYDLVANIAAQPLLALHWFNPLAWWGWRAMRRDQEAACDARVVAGRERSERAAYAEVIAGFAAGPNLALAAPMACPVLGEKSIIHRLRSLTMSDIPSGRKKLGIAAIATTALAALPLTASISYAQPDAPELPAVPSAAPLPPEAPLPPAVPVAPMPATPAIESIDPDEAHHTVRIAVLRDGETEGETHVLRERSSPSDNSETYVIRREFSDADGDNREFQARREFIERDEMKRRFANIDRQMEQLEALEGLDELEQLERLEALEELEDMDVHMRVAFAEARGAIAESQRAMVAVRSSMPRVEMRCDGDEVVQHRQLADGRNVVMVCQSAALSQASNALRQAQSAIRSSQGLSQSERDRIVNELDAEIERLERQNISAAPKLNRQAQAKLRVPDAPRAYAAAPSRVLRSASVQFNVSRTSQDPMDDDCEEEGATSFSI